MVATSVYSCFMNLAIVEWEARSQLELQALQAAKNRAAQVSRQLGFRLERFSRGRSKDRFKHGKCSENGINIPPGRRLQNRSKGALRGHLEPVWYDFGAIM